MRAAGTSFILDPVGIRTEGTGKMHRETTLKRHAALVDNMARARGVDLEEQMLRGKLTISELEDAVLRCTACTSPEACEHWLAEQSKTAAETPEYCLNANVFRALDEG